MAAHRAALCLGLLCAARGTARAEEPGAAPRPALEPSAPAEAEGPPPSPGPPTSEEGATEAPSAEPPPEAPSLVEVEVHGERTEGERGQPPSEQRLGRRDVERMPGAFGDAFRAIDALPGVAPMASGLPHLLVRGAAPSASGYYIDGIRVPFLFHLAIGPSVINPALVGDVRLHAGGYPARWGRHVGGIVDASTRGPATDTRVEGHIRLFDAGVYAEVPLFEDRLNAFGAVRYAYPGPLLSLVAPDTTLNYWDYQAGVGYALSKTDRVRLFAFGSRDDLGQRDEGEAEPKQVFGVEFHRFDLRFERTPERRADGTLDAWARLGFTFGVDRTVLSDEAAVDARSYNLRNDFDAPLWSWLRLRGGVDFLAEELDIVTREEEDDDEEKDDELEFNIARAFESRAVGTAGAYADVVVTPVDELELIGGMRVDVFAEPGATEVGLDPRGSVRFAPLPWLTSLSAVGLSHQKPTLFVNFPGLDPVGLDDGLQSALQVSQGFEVALPEQIRASITGFWHRYRDLTDLTATCSVGIDQCSASDRADGSAYGMELLLQRPLSTRVGGLVSYTLSRAERTIGDESFAGDFDRAHVLNAALGVELGSGWNVGARFTAYSGRPYSLIKFDDPQKPTRPTLIGHRNVLRRPPFFRLDARIEKRWVIADRGWVSLVLEGFNITGQRETVDFDCRVAEVVGSQTGLNCGGQEIGPISIPSLGVSGGI